MRISRSGMASIEPPVVPIPSFNYEGVKLLIGLPTRGDCSIDFACSLAVSVSMLTAAKVEVSIQEGRNSCFVDMNRNMLMAVFLESDCTHLLQIDDDMGWTRDAPLRMLAKDVDFVAGAGPMKGESEQYACTIKTNENGLPMGYNGLIEASKVGGAFTLIKKTAVQAMVKAYPEMKCEVIDKDFGYRFYEHEYSGNSWKTEDYVFCERWTALGGQIWVYPDIDFIHKGTKNFNGNFHKFLMGRSEQPKAIEEYKQSIPPVPDNIKQMLCESFVRTRTKQISVLPHVQDLLEKARAK